MRSLTKKAVTKQTETLALNVQSRARFMSARESAHSSAKFFLIGRIRRGGTPWMRSAPHENAALSRKRLGKKRGMAWLRSLRRESQVCKIIKN